MQPTYFRSPSDFRRWLEKNHAKTAELYVGFHKKSSGEPSLTYPEALDEALCFGWIDGVRKSVDDGRYMIRFTPRKPGSKWSAVNIKKAEALKAAGRMAPPGLAAFDGRNPERAGYSFEERPSALDPDLEARFRENSKAWEFFQAQPPGYRRVAIWYVVSAKKDETRLRRLERLIADSENGVRLPMMTTTKKGA
jgi:uncharacterized protein YdeI (YjbR/CyaY-like superfamily)